MQVNVVRTELATLSCLHVQTYMALLQGQFRKAHPSVHTVADMGYILGLQWGKTERAAKISREILGALYRM